MDAFAYAVLLVQVVCGKTIRLHPFQTPITAYEGKRPLPFP